jgi:hypothetical protein
MSLWSPIVDKVERPGTPIGVIVGMDESQIRVRFDKDTDERLFARRSSLLARVSIAGAVRRISTGAVGYINGSPALTLRDGRSSWTARS